MPQSLYIELQDRSSANKLADDTIRINLNNEQFAASAYPEIPTPIAASYELDDSLLAEHTKVAVYHPIFSRISLAANTLNIALASRSIAPQVASSQRHLAEMPPGNELEERPSSKSEQELSNPDTEVTYNKELIESLAGAGLDYIQITDGGHCLYDAVGLFLGRYPIMLRKQVIDSLVRNQQGFSNFINFPRRNLNDYLNAIRNSDEGPDNIEIEVLMRVLNRPIFIIGPEGRLTNSAATERFNGEPIFVYYNGIDHYDALLLKSGHTARTVLARLQHQPNAILPGPQAQVGVGNLNQEFATSLPKTKIKPKTALDNLALWAVQQDNVDLLEVLLGSAIEQEMGGLIDELYRLQIRLHMQRGLQQWLMQCKTFFHETKITIDVSIKTLMAEVQIRVGESAKKWVKEHPHFFFSANHIQLARDCAEFTPIYKHCLDTVASIYQDIASQVVLDEMQAKFLALKAQLDDCNRQQPERIFTQLAKAIGSKIAQLQNKFEKLADKIKSHEKNYQRHLAQRCRQLTEQLLRLPLHQRNTLLTVGESVLSYYVSIDLLVADKDSSLLHAAVLNYQVTKKLDMIHFLLNHGANPVLKNQKGISPMALALALPDKGQCFDILLSALQAYLNKCKQQIVDEQLKLTVKGLSAVEAHLFSYGKTLSLRSKYSARKQQLLGFTSYFAERAKQFCEYCTAYSTAIKTLDLRMLFDTFNDISKKASTRFFNLSRSQLNRGMEKKINQFQKQHAKLLQFDEGQSVELKEMSENEINIYVRTSPPSASQLMLMQRLSDRLTPKKAAVMHSESDCNTEYALDKVKGYRYRQCSSTFFFPRYQRVSELESLSHVPIAPLVPN